MKTLQDAIAVELDAADRHLACCIELWKILQMSHPMLADQIQTLFAGDTAAAKWVCGRNAGSPSPAQLIAAGETAKVEELLLRSMHGMGA